MKKRLILKVLGLLLLLPMFSGCNDTDDVAGIFTGKTWKLTYITKANGHGWYKFADVDDSNIMEYADGKKNLFQECSLQEVHFPLPVKLPGEDG